MTDWQKVFNKGFRRAFREIEYLQDKINQTNGLLIFRWHIYTINELLNSEHHSKIYSITEKIGNDCISWYKRGVMPEEGKEIYENKKFEIEENLHLVNRKIKQRKPTWLEEAFNLLDKFVEMVMDNMPPLLRTKLEGLIVTLASLPGIGFLGKSLLQSKQTERKLLEPGDNFWQ